LKKGLLRLKGLFTGRDKGTVAVTFILSLPILMLIVSIMVQYALLATGRVAFERSLAAAARSAMVALPTDPDVDNTNGKSYVERAAYLSLAPLSPPADTVSSDAATVAQALAGAGVSVPSDFGRRYTFAQTGTTVTIENLKEDVAGSMEGINYAKVAGGRVRITIIYPFRLNVPFANLIAGDQTSIAGVSGKYFWFKGQVDVQLSDGRIVGTDNNGGPLGGMP